MLVGLIFTLVPKLRVRRFVKIFEIVIFIWTGPTKQNKEEMVRNRTSPDEIWQSEVDGGVRFITVHGMTSSKRLIRKMIKHLRIYSYWSIYHMKL